MDHLGFLLPHFSFLHQLVQRARQPVHGLVHGLFARIEKVNGVVGLGGHLCDAASHGAGTDHADYGVPVHGAKISHARIMQEAS